MKISDIKKLHQKKYRTQFGCYLIEGEHLILELCKAITKHSQAYNNSATNITLYVTNEKLDWANTLAVKFTIVLLTQKQMLDISDTKTPQGMMARVPFSWSFDQSKNQGTKNVYLYETQDPGNLGTILRTLAWFGGFRLLLSPNSVDPYNPKVIRASMGAIFHVDIQQDIQLNELEQRFETFAYLDLQGQTINSKAFSNYDCYLFGNEARGVPHEDLAMLNAKPFTIDGSGNIDSLNLASAVNICAYQLSQK